MIGPGHCPSQLSSTAPFSPAGRRPPPGTLRPRAPPRCLCRGDWVRLALSEPCRGRPLLLRQPHPPASPLHCAPSLSALHLVRDSSAPRSNHLSHGLGALAERAASWGDALRQGSTEFAEQGRQSLPAGRLGSPEPEPSPWLGRPAPPQRGRGAGQGDAAQPPDAAPGPVRLAGQGQGTGSLPLPLRLPLASESYSHLSSPLLAYWPAMPFPLDLGLWVRHARAVTRRPPGRAFGQVGARDGAYPRCVLNWECWWARSVAWCTCLSAV